jgi:hypothetical protein
MAKYLLGLMACVLVSPWAMAGSKVLHSDFESNGVGWSLLYGCQLGDASPRSGKGSMRCEPGSSTMISKQATAEMGLMEFWIKPENEFTDYKITILTSASTRLDSVWTPIALIEGPAGGTNYLAHRISIDDVARKYLRIDIDAHNGSVSLDDVSVEKLMLDTALQKNEQKIISGILDKIKQDNNYELQAESFRTLASSYSRELETQRQYLEYANGIYSSISLVLATSERNRMANPLLYSTFKSILTDTKRVSSPLQQARLNSMVKPFGDLVTATLNVVSAGAYSAFAEPFKSFLATTFDRSNYENADLSRQDRKFAEHNGLTIYQRAESFLAELEKELQQANALDQELAQILRNTDSYRKDLEKYLRDYMQYGGLPRTQENYSRLISKEESLRSQAMLEVRENIARRANALSDARKQTELVQYMLRTSDHIEGTLAFKERFNQLTAQVITFYERFERSVAKEQNPFTDAADKALWEKQALKARDYVKQSRDAFLRAYM